MFSTRIMAPSVRVKPRGVCHAIRVSLSIPEIDSLPADDPGRPRRAERSAVGARADCFPVHDWDLRASIRPRSPPRRAGDGPSGPGTGRGAASGPTRGRRPPFEPDADDTSVVTSYWSCSCARMIGGGSSAASVGAGVEVVRLAEVGAGPLQLPTSGRAPRRSDFSVRHLVPVHQLRLLRRRRRGHVDQVLARGTPRFPVLRLLLAKLRRPTGAQGAEHRSGPRPARTDGRRRAGSWAPEQGRRGEGGLQVAQGQSRPGGRAGA